MQLTIDISDEVVSSFPPDEDPARFILESFAVDAYRMGRFTEGDVRSLLGYGTPMQVHSLLADHDVPLNYTVEELQHDIQVSNQFIAERLAEASKAA